MSDSPVARDKLKGVRAISLFIDESERRTYYLCENQLIPAFKIGTIWHSSKSALQRHYCAGPAA